MYRFFDMSHIFESFVWKNCLKLTEETQFRFSVFRWHVQGGDKSPITQWRPFMSMSFHMCSAESTSGREALNVAAADGCSRPLILPLMSRVSAILVPPGLRGDYEKESLCHLFLLTFWPPPGLSIYPSAAWQLRAASGELLLPGVLPHHPLPAEV